MEDVLLGIADRTILVFIPDPASTDGSGKTGLTHSDLTVSYTRAETDNDVVVTDVTSLLTTLTNLTDAHADWGVKEVSSTLAPGLYRLDVEDAVFASGAWYAVVYVMMTTSAAAAVPKGFKLVAYNPLDATRLGLGALPNAAAGANGGLPTGNGSGHVTLADSSLVTAKLGTFALAKTTNLTGLNDIAATAIVSSGAITTSGGAIDTVTTLTNLPAITANWLTAAGIAADVTTELQGGLATAASQTTIAAYLDTEVAAIKAKTDQLAFTETNKVDATLFYAGVAVEPIVPDDAPANFGLLGINGSGHVSRVTLVDTLTTYTSNTPQTGDAFARIGALGAGLSSIPWNASWDAEVQSEVEDALAAKLALASGTIASTTGTTTTLDSGALANADYYVSAKLVTKTGTGAGQERIITAYSVGRAATHAAWDVNPDAATTYEIVGGRSSATVSGGGDATLANQERILKVLQT